MWKNYSKSYIKNNRASSLSIMAAALVAAMFLSLLCCTGYNFWIYEIEKIVLEEGDWQGRIVGRIDENDLNIIQSFATVKKAVVNQEVSEKEDIVIDVFFHNARTIYQDLPLIVEQLASEDASIQYHELLLSRYFIHDPQDDEPPMLLAVYLGILLIVAVSLILIIRNSFELTMNARIHQFGILSSIGATPKQIRICLLQEAMALSIVPILLGSLLGILISCGLIKAINIFAGDAGGRHEAVFQYRAFLFAGTVFLSVLTVLFSAWIPARNLSRMTPLEAIRNADSLQLKKRKHSRLLSVLFGMKGELAGNALKAQKKALRISSISLLLSFLGFSIMLCFTTLADISTRYTYFERYQDAWDVMITVKNIAISDFELTEALQKVSGAEAVTIYQKAETVELLQEDCQSEELTELGGFQAVSGKSNEEGRCRVEAPIIVLDDASFLAYCSQIGIAPSLDGAVVLNQIWDSVNSNFRYKEYVPFVKEEKKESILHNCSVDDQEIKIPILSYTQITPVLREEYKDYALVHFIPLSMWKEISEAVGGLEPDSYIRIFSSGNADLADLNALEKEAVQILEQEYEIESENRVQERLLNDSMIQGMVMILGGFCVLLAIIGIANVFSNTLGFLRQRKREFAQYMSIGLTPQEMRQMFCIEAFVIAGKPLLITMPLTVLFVQFAVTASYLDPMVFWTEAPVVPILVFAAAIVLFVALAYYIGGKRLLRCNLNETLRNDALV